MDGPKVTLEISTKNRLDILSNCLQSIAMQTYKPAEIIIFDDSDQFIDPRVNSSKYASVFSIFDLKGIPWKVLPGQKKGQVANHQAVLDMASTEWIWRCFRGDERVETINGLVKIRDIKVGELVKTHLGRWKKVIRTYKHEYKQRKPLIWVNTNFSTIKCTPEHPFLVRTEKGDKWMVAEKIELGSTLLYPNKSKEDRLEFDCYSRGSKGDKSKQYTGINFKNEYFGNVEIDTDMARFFGLYLAEGCGGHDSIRFTFNNNEEEYIKFVTSICQNKFDRTPTIHKRWATCIKLNIKSFSKKFTEWFGNDATNKRVPDFVFSWSLTNRLSFLRGYFEGDGWDVSRMCRFGTSSRELYSGIQKLATSCGLDCYEPYVRPAKESFISGRSVFTKESYEGSLSSCAHGKLFDLLEAKQNGDYLEIKVKSVERKLMTGNPSDQYVYNLEVEDDNSYIVGPVIVHNCDDDNIVEPNVLEKLVRHTFNDKVGAVASVVLHPGAQFHPNSTSGDIKDCNFKYAVQFARFNGVKEVDHLYSTFLYRRSAALKHGYEKDLSPVGHREETMFSYNMRREGWKLLVDGTAITWHFQNPTGGIRDYSDGSMWGRDQAIFEKRMAEWGVKFNKYKPIYLDCGIGDHFAFKHIVPEIKEKFKDHKLIAGVCYPEVFADMPEIELVDLNSAKIIFGGIHDALCAYRYGTEKNFRGSIVDIYRNIYLK